VFIPVEDEIVCARLLSYSCLVIECKLVTFVANNLCNAARSVDDVAVVSMLAEATFVRHGIFTVSFNSPDCMLTKCDINKIISNICLA